MTRASMPQREDWTPRCRNTAPWQHPRRPANGTVPEVGRTKESILSDYIHVKITPKEVLKHAMNWILAGDGWEQYMGRAHSTVLRGTSARPMRREGK